MVWHKIRPRGANSRTRFRFRSVFAGARSSSAGFASVFSVFAIMSMIEKMFVMGIRSFGTRDKDTQMIEFQHPLTLIVGQNGAGKTTIIECLKYATTGDQPANTRGGAFVNDPKLVGETEVRAQVALKFNDIKGQKCSVKRSLQVTQKADKLVPKTLDAMIEKTVGDELVSMTSKCADVNAEMVMALGVSKAVLENVIFCHQEDSNWPLSEGKVLKNKFDDIFAATRYIKALDAIKAAKVKQAEKHKIEGTKLPFLEISRNTAKEKKKNLQDHMMKLSMAEESLKKVEEEQIPLNKKLKEKQKSREEIMQYDSRLQQDSNRQKHLKDDRKLLEKRIQNVFGGTDAQLQHVIEDQEKLMDQKKVNLGENQQRIDPVKAEIEALTKKKSSLTLKQGELQQEFKSFQDKQSERAVLLLTTSQEYDLSTSFTIDANLSEADATRFEMELKKLVRKTDESMKSKQNRSEQEINAQGKEIQKVWGAKTEIEEGLKHKQQAIREKRRKILETTQEMRNLQSSSDSDRLEELQRQLEQSEKELKSAEDSVDMSELKEEEKKLIRAKSQHELNLRQIDEEIVNMQKHEQTRTTIEVLTKQRCAKEETARRLKRRNIDNLSSINVIQAGGDAEKQKFPTRQSLSQWISKTSENETTLRKALDKKRQVLTKLSTQLDMLTREQDQKQKRIKDIEDKMFELCGSEQFEQELSQLEEDIKELQQSKGVTDGVQFVYKEFLEKLRSSASHEDTPCPLCHRLFDQASEVAELADELDRKLEMAPRRVLTQKQDLERKQRRYQALLQQKPANEEMAKLSSETLPNLRKQIAERKVEISKLRQVISEEEGGVRKVQDDCAVAQSCSNDVSQVESTQSEINDLRRKINLEEAKLSGTESSGKSFETANQEKQQLLKTVQTHNRSIEEIRERIGKQTNRLFSLKDNLNSLQADKLRIASNVEKCKQLKELLKNTTEETKKLEEQCADSEVKIEPLERQLTELEGKKKAAVEKRDDELKTASDYLQFMRAKYQEIQKSNSDIKKYVQSGRQGLLEKTQAATKKIDADLNNKNQDLNRLREEISRIEKELATCKDRQRDLDDNLALRKQDKAIQDIKKNIEELKEKLCGMDPVKLESEITELSRQWHVLSKEKERCGERQKHMEENVKAVKAELEKEEYKFADERYRDCLIDVTTMKLAMDDLEKYRNALDRAIMRYHSLKMADINKIIKEIWSETYRGTDIEFIEICSDEDTTSSTSSKRVYNYRLVKCCNGQRIDMRGRCSAGQKVLASLVIRLALAETFCINCGILALDEPTTNLDRHHIESLASALVRIIEMRQQQANFQLLVITHDEEFVELLGRSNYVDHYFRVEKYEGKSRILKSNIQTLD